MEKSIKISSPGTVSNLGCGFDILGFALENPVDEMIIKTNKLNKIQIRNLNKYNYVPVDPAKNVAGVALQSLLNMLSSKQGFDIEIKKPSPYISYLMKYFGLGFRVIFWFFIHEDIQPHSSSCCS